MTRDADLADPIAFRSREQSGSRISTATQTSQDEPLTSSIHLRSAAVRCTRGVTLGSANSIVAVSTCQWCQTRSLKLHAAYIDDHVRSTIPLRLYDAVCRSDQIRMALEQIKLLQWKVWLEESVLRQGSAQAVERSPILSYLAEQIEW